MAKKKSDDLSYETKTIIVILLLLFILPAGIVLMWIWMKWPTWLKVLVTIIPFLFTFFIALFVGWLLTTIFSNKDVQKQLYEQMNKNSHNSQATRNTSHWKTYTNSAFHYAFQYPPDFRSLPGFGNHVFYSQDSTFDPTTKAKTHGIEVGSVVYGPDEDTQAYIGPNTKTDETLSSQLVLPPKATAKAYVNREDITVAIDYVSKNKNMRIVIWCGGDNDDSTACKNVLIPLLSTFRIIQ
jgi:hypothetical protein